ncbi:hypothetical protein ISCGN_026731 [Ixodes scapularis]
MDHGLAPRAVPELNFWPNGSFFTRVDKWGRPNVKVSRAEVPWLVFARVNDLNVCQTRQFACSQFAIAPHMQTDWFGYVREEVAATRAAMPKLGGPGKVVRADEALFRSRRKANVGRLLAHDGFGPWRNNFDSRICGPWIFGMIDVDTNELRMIRVHKRGTLTLCREIWRHIAPGMTIVTDELAAYQRIPALMDGAGASLQYTHHTVNHRRNFVDPRRGAHTQKIENTSGPAKALLLRNMKGWCGRGANTQRGRAEADRILQTNLDWC